METLARRSSALWVGTEMSETDNEEIDRTCKECGGLIVVPTSDDDDLCAGCTLTSGKHYMNSAGPMRLNPGRAAPASEECGRDV